MNKGIVKWFSIRKGYGFIETKESDDVFVHNSALSGGLVTLSEGNEVEFDIVQGPKGPKAENVTIVN